MKQYHQQVNWIKFGAVLLPFPSNHQASEHTRTAAAVVGPNLKAAFLFILLIGFEPTYPYWPKLESWVTFNKLHMDWLLGQNHPASGIFCPSCAIEFWSAQTIYTVGLGKWFHIVVLCLNLILLVPDWISFGRMFAQQWFAICGCDCIRWELIFSTTELAVPTNPSPSWNCPHKSKFRVHCLLSSVMSRLSACLPGLCSSDCTPFNFRSDCSRGQFRNVEVWFDATQCVTRWWEL